jgi:sec-independent protein translocase protein TatA
MNLFGIGVPEFILIFILALIVLGPRRLPALANRAGRQIREWRMMSQVFLVEWREELAALEEARLSFEEAKQALTEARQIVTSELNQVQQTVSTEVSATQQDISEQLIQAEAEAAALTGQTPKAMTALKEGVAVEPTVNETASTVASPVATEDSPAATTPETPSPVMLDKTAEDDSDVLEVTDDVISNVSKPQPPKPTSTSAPASITPRPASLRVITSDESDVSEVQTINDIATEIATKVAQSVAAEVSAEVAKKVATEVAAEIARMVTAQNVQAAPVDKVTPAAVPVEEIT